MRISPSRSFRPYRKRRVYQPPHVESGVRLLMAGYSGTPLIQKIGIKPGHRIILRNHPASFLKDLGKLPEGAESADRLSGKANVIVYFTDQLAKLQKDFARLSASLVPDGMLWIGWPKKPGGR